MKTPPNHSSSVRTALFLTLVVCLLVSSVGCVSIRPGSGPDERRWETDQEKYENLSVPRKIGSNVGNGLVGVFDNGAQGAFSGALILSPYGGFLASKIGTVVGDVVGLIDDNPVTQPVFQGIVSRQFLRFGAGAAKMQRGVAAVHDGQIEAPEALPGDAYIGDHTWHTDAYIEQSGIVTLGGALVSDWLIRPVGNICLIFGGRDIQSNMDEFGLGLIESSFEVKGP
jgi:hypothetical protein